MQFVFLSALFVFFACLFITYYVYLITFHVDRKKEISKYSLTPCPKMKIDKNRIFYLIDDLCSKEHEDVSIVSFDGLTLRGKYYHCADGAPLSIQFHGYRSAAVRDFCGAFRVFRDMGHNVLLVDERAHGESDGHVITFGIKERFDCISWIDYANSRFGVKTPIIIVGMSMGAATVLMASELGLPENVVGIIADSPYTSPEDIILKVAADRRYPKKIIQPFMKLAARYFGKFDISESSARSAVTRCTKPVLLIHGEGDFFVPSHMTSEIYSLCRSKKKKVILPNNGHCVSYIFNTERYISEVRKFAYEVLGGK